MEEISEYIYQMFSIILICIGFSIVLMQYENLINMSSDIDFSGYNAPVLIRSGDNSAANNSAAESTIKERNEIIAGIMNGKAGTVYLNGKELFYKNRLLTDVIGEITGEKYLVEYKRDEAERTVGVYYTEVR